MKHETYSEKETAARFDKLLHTAMNMKPVPLKDIPLKPWTKKKTGSAKSSRRFQKRGGE